MTEDRFCFYLSSVFCPLSSEIGGGERDRTDDPLLAKQVLSQLSYTPRIRGQRTQDRRQISRRREATLLYLSSVLCLLSSDLVGLVGVEPTTPALSRRCSNQLSYRPHQRTED